MLDRVRALCLGLPETEERASHGAPSWFVKKGKQFAVYQDDHHGDGRLALWCPAPAGMQQALVETNADAYFVPPYVGYRGWIGVRLDRDLPWDDVAGALEDAYCEVAPRRLLDSLSRHRG